MNPEFRRKSGHTHKGEQRKKTKEFREMRWDPVNKRRGSFGETKTQKNCYKIVLMEKTEN